MRRLASLTVLIATLALGLIAGLTGTAQAATAPKLTAPRITSLQDQVLALVNQARKSGHCAPLKANAALTKAARGHSADMAARHYFAHNTPAGVTPWTRIAQAGYPKATLAENIAAGQSTPAAVVKAWLNSPDHRRNIMNCDLKSVGTGLAVGGTYGYYWTQDFGSR